MLEIINIDESEKWDSIVKSFSNYDVYYMSGYTKAFKLHGDGEPTLIYYHDEKIRAINVVMIRDIAEDKRFKDKIETKSLFDITTPYGYGGFIIEGIPNDNNLKKFNEEYSDYCRSKNIISEFVRFHPVLKNSKINSEIYEVIDLGKTITMDLISKEQIWNDLSSKNRNVIRKAIKSGVEVYWGRSPELIDEFIPLYNATMNKDEATDYYYFNKEFYNCVLEDLKYNSLIFYALYDQKVISISMIIYGNDKMHYHLSASDRKYQNLAATNLLLYEAACWGCENGFKSFHLGGGLGSKEDSLFKFKKAFNKNSETYFSIGKKIFNQEKYYDLIGIREKDTEDNVETSFFPRYRK
ncbi:MAG TPA: GNAT family N-acetyltransferase [Acholeplasmataceae bacterium]|nr:GNAT family N-acetyltransferase [Acholeplasmataceae bacterium]